MPRFFLVKCCAMSLSLFDWLTFLFISQFAFWLKFPSIYSIFQTFCIWEANVLLIVILWKGDLPNYVSGGALFKLLIQLTQRPLMAAVNTAACIQCKCMGGGWWYNSELFLFFLMTSPIFFESPRLAISSRIIMNCLLERCAQLEWLERYSNLVMILFTSRGGPARYSNYSHTSRIYTFRHKYT